MIPIILAAGPSTRTRPLTFARPKPLLPFFEKTILENTLDNLVGLFPEVVIVVKFLQEQIREKIGNSYKGMKVHYFEQTGQPGTGGVISQVRTLYEPPFLVLNGDDIYARVDIENLMKHDRAALISETATQSRTLDGWRVLNGKLVSLGAKDAGFDFGVATGGYILSEEYFALPPVQLEGKEEFGLPQTLAQGVAQTPYDAVFVRGYWYPVGFAWDVLKVHDQFWGDRAEKIVQGRNCRIDPSAEIGERVILGDNVVVGKNAKISHAIVMHDTKIGEGSQITHSILGAHNMVGRNVAIEYLCKTGTWHVQINEKDVDTGEKELGIFTDDACVIPDGAVMMGATLLNNTEKIL